MLAFAIGGAKTLETLANFVFHIFGYVGIIQRAPLFVGYQRLDLLLDGFFVGRPHARLSFDAVQL